MDIDIHRDSTFKKIREFSRIITKANLLLGRRKQLRNEFHNRNVEHWAKWIFRRKDHLNGVTVYFLSKRNSTSPRFFPLYENTQNFRIILFRGPKLPYIDNFVLFFLRAFCIIFASKLSRYRWLAIYSEEAILRAKTNVILHIDDPEYSIEELESVQRIIEHQFMLNKKTKLFVTNPYTLTYFESRLENIEIIILPQGYNSFSSISFQSNKPKEFVAVYSSPYIDYIGDKHEKHTAWNAIHLLNDLIPEINRIDPSIKIRLIGRVGARAKARISELKNVEMCGYVNFEENMKLLGSSSVGLYPRTFDHKRSVQKIYEYAGASLPVVSYNLIDTQIIQDEHWGIVVNTAQEMIDAIVTLKQNPLELENYRKQISKTNKQYSWRALAERYDREVVD